MLDLESTFDGVVDAWSLSHCTGAADVKDAAAKALMAKMADLLVLLGQIDVPIRAKLAEATPAAFEQLCGRDDVSHMTFYLKDERSRAEIAMAPELEELHEALARDGLHAWGRLYDQVSGKLDFELQPPGEKPRRVPVSMTRT